VSEDRTYIRTTGAWHAFVTWTRVPGRARTLCGRTLAASLDAPPDADYPFHAGYEQNDRVPSGGHLCGNCGRLIAAHTDIEGE
jgi:hypothetical protein